MALRILVGWGPLEAGEHVSLSLCVRVLHVLRPCLPCLAPLTLVLGAAVVASHVVVVLALSRGLLCVGACTLWSVVAVHTCRFARGLDYEVEAVVVLEVHAAWPRTQPAVGAPVAEKMREFLPVVAVGVAACH